MKRTKLVNFVTIFAMVFSAFALTFSLCAVPAYATDISDGAAKTSIQKQKTKMKVKVETVKNLSGRSKEIYKEAKKLISSGKVSKASKDLEKLKNLKAKAVNVRKKAKELRKGYSSLKPLYQKVSTITKNISGRYHDIKNRIAKAKKTNSSHSAAAKRLRANGVIYSNGWRYTYYSQKVLPGYGLDIPGRHVGANGLIKDGSGRVCVASSSHSKGTVLKTPFGTAKVYDTGCPYGTIDIYVNW